MGYNKYDIGDLVRLSGEFKDINENLADPTTVTLIVTSPSRVDYTYTLAQAEVIRASVGLYYYDFDTSGITNDDAGTWHYRFVGTGAVQAAEEKAFIIRFSAVLDD